MALLYLDEDTVPELLIRKDREYELYFFDGSKVQPISMSDAGIKANTYGSKHGIEVHGEYRTPYWFEYVPQQGLVRIHEDGEEERHDYYLRYTDGVLCGERGAGQFGQMSCRDRRRLERWICCVEGETEH